MEFWQDILITESGWNRCCCGHEEEECDFQISDYVSLPMLWCGGCSGRFFLDAPLKLDGKYTCYSEQDIAFAKETNYSIITPWVPLEIDFSRLERVGYRGDEIIYRVRPCLIQRVLGSNVSHYAKNLTEEQISELKSKIVDEKHMLTKGEIPEDIFEKFGLEEIDKDDRLDNQIMTFSEPCDSYNVLSPKIAYPEWMSTDHDGISVICTMIYQGNINIARYWGD